MRVGINLLFLKPGIAGGTETYCYGLLNAFAELAPQDFSFFIFCSDKPDLKFLENQPGFTIIRFRSVSASVGYRYFFEQTFFPFKLKKYNLDLLHSFGYVGPVFFKNHITTIHDTNAFAHEDMSSPKKILLQKFLKATARKCSHIIAVSAFTKGEIIKHLRSPEEKISVVHEASRFACVRTPLPLPGSFKELENKKYFVALGSVTKNKNLPVLIEAFQKLLSIIPEIRLVLVGHLPEDNSIQTYITTLRLSEQIIITGYLVEKELAAILQHAVCFVFPSLYEGFGLPVLEAQSLGVAVIASNRSAIPEIGRESVLYFNGNDSSELAQKMLAIVSDTNLQEHYIKAGLENSRRFSWKSTAEKTLDVYEKVYWSRAVTERDEG